MAAVTGGGSEFGIQVALNSATFVNWLATTVAANPFMSTKS